MILVPQFLHGALLPAIDCGTVYFFPQLLQEKLIFIIPPIVAIDKFYSGSLRIVLVKAEAIKPVGIATMPRPIIKTMNVKILPPVVIG